MVCISHKQEGCNLLKAKHYDLVTSISVIFCIILCCFMILH